MAVNMKVAKKYNATQTTCSSLMRVFCFQMVNQVVREIHEIKEVESLIRIVNRC